MTAKSKSWFIILYLTFGITFLFPSIVHAQTPISCGEIKTGSISTVGERDDYTFDANAGDAITIWLRVTSGSMNPYFELYDSTGNRIANGNSGTDITIANAGTYTIGVSDFGNNDTGNYNIT